MQAGDRHLLGVDINLKAINLCQFDFSGHLYFRFQLNLPQPAMPGAVIVALCEQIEVIDPERRVDLVGVSVPGEIDSLGRIVKSSLELPGWIDVPLIDWLEPRLSRKVIIVNFSKSLMVDDDSQVMNNRCDCSHFRALAAAILDCERLNCFEGTP